MRQLGLLLLLILLLLLLQLGQKLGTAYNYCYNPLHVCNKKGLKHFICEDHVPYLNKTKYVATIPDTLRFREFILSYYNKYRNLVAGGYLTTLQNKTFKPASRMRELIWDLELAYTARLHAETVSFKHSACRSVARFPYAGECIGIVQSYKHRRSLADILDLTIRFMFESYMEVQDPDRLITQFRIPEDMPLGQFTMLVSDRVSRVGCGFVVAKDCNLKDIPGFCYMMTCHYDFINLGNSYTYLTGEPASNCSDWNTFPSRSYTNLCHNTGEIFPYS
ncbi:venom allergen 3-like [Drosophila innubila]|uniref:venom allergen 3-like n=1 Tax=Drosophila innubila TaxID=198719 RepID=UPI00148DE61E|nr:venom allergen 3-like [Drosophila innubila]